MKKSRKERKLIPIKFDVPDSIISRFVTHTTITTLYNELKISFFEIDPALEFGPNKKRPKEYHAKCVASVIITADRIPRFIECLESQLKQCETVR